MASEVVAICIGLGDVNNRLCCAGHVTLARDALA